MKIKYTCKEFSHNLEDFKGKEVYIITPTAEEYERINRLLSESTLGFNCVNKEEHRKEMGIRIFSHGNFGSWFEFFNKGMFVLNINSYEIK